MKQQVDFDIVLSLNLVVDKYKKMYMLGYAYFEKCELEKVILQDQEQCNYYMWMVYKIDYKYQDLGLTKFLEIMVWDT